MGGNWGKIGGESDEYRRGKKDSHVIWITERKDHGQASGGNPRSKSGQLMNFFSHLFWGSDTIDLPKRP